jgi:hypothetical protein
MGHWEKPPPGWKKTNWGAALDKARKRMSVGMVVVRDEEDVVVAASMVIVPLITDPTLAKALRVWQALSVSSARDLSCSL